MNTIKTDKAQLPPPSIEDFDNLVAEHSDDISFPSDFSREDNYLVAAIVGEAIYKDKKDPSKTKTWWLVRWSNEEGEIYPGKEDTWEPYENVYGNEKWKEWKTNIRSEDQKLKYSKDAPQPLQDIVEEDTTWTRYKVTYNF